MFFRRHSQPSGSGWQGMATAPRDGTVVELCCTYGVAPWYGRHRWSGESEYMGSDGERRTFVGEPTWQAVDRPGQSVDDGDYLQWRPTSSASQYVDPTGGAQDTREYWIAACGLNPDNYPKGRLDGKGA